MLKRFFRGRIAAFEKEWDYDASHLRELVEASPSAFLKISLAQPLLQHREGVPAAAYAAAGITTVHEANCGPCFELTLKMARRAGVPDELVEAIAMGDESRMTEEARTGYRFAKAVLARDVPEAARLRGEILRKWGRKALVSLSIAVAMGGFYPTLKYGLGHGRSIGGLKAAVAAAKARAA